MGLAIDCHYAHVARVRSIKETFGADIPFPIIADLDLKVAQAYGMVQPGASDTQAVRATFIINPESILRAMVYCRRPNGCSVDEFYRLIQALQASDTRKVATPAKLDAS